MDKTCRPLDTVGWVIQDAEYILGHRHFLAAAEARIQWLQQDASASWDVRTKTMKVRAFESVLATRMQAIPPAETRDWIADNHLAAA